MATQLKKTVKPSGQGGDYTTLTSCIDGNLKNFVTANEYFDVEIDGNWSSADTSVTSITTSSGITTDATHYINIYTTATARHAGVYSTSKYRMDTSASGYAIQVCSCDVRITGLQFNCTTGLDILDLEGSDDNEIYFSKNLVRAYCATNSNTPVYIQTPHYFEAFNNIFYYVDNRVTPTGSSRYFDFEEWNDDPTVIYKFCNNTCYLYSNYQAGGETYSCYLFYYGNYNSAGYEATFILKNNIMQIRGSTNNPLVYSTDSSGGMVTAANITSDDSSPDGASFQNKTVTFVTTTLGSEDLHLSSSDTVAKDQGVDLSSLFTDDIDGDTRSGTWDIGADEIIGTSTPRGFMTCNKGYW